MTRLRSCLMVAALWLPLSLFAEMTFSDVQIEGRIAGEAFTFRLALTATADRDMGTGVLLRGPAVLRQAVAGDGWRVRFDPVAGAYLLEMDRANVPAKVALEFVAQTPAGPDAAWREVVLPMPQAQTRQVTILADRQDLQLTLPGALGVKRETVQQQLRVSAFLRAGASLTVQWKPQLTVTEAALVASCEVNTIVRAETATLRIDGLLRYTINQGKLREVVVQVPPGLQVTLLQGQYIREWKVEESGGQRRLVVQLNREVDRQYQLQLLGELPLAPLPAETDVPALVPLNVNRADGFLALGTDSALQLQVRSLTGLTQVDGAGFPRMTLAAPEVPRPLPGRNTFFYGFAAAGYQLRLAVAEVVPAYDVESRLVLRVKDDDLAADLELELDVRDAPIRRVALQLPAAMAVAGVTGAQVGDYSVDTPASGPRTLTIELAQPAEGRVALQVRLELGRSPLGSTQELAGLAVKGARNQRGFIVVVPDPGVTVANPVANGLRPINVRALPMRVADAQFAWRFREAGWTLGLPIAERPAAIRAESFHLVAIADGVVYDTVTFTYLIAGAPVDELSFRVDPTLKKVEFVGADVSQWRQEGDVYKVKLRRKVIGDYNLGVTCSQRYENGATILAGGIEPAAVETQSGFLVVTSHLNVRLTDGKLEPALIAIGADELPGQYRLLVSAPILRSYKYVATPATAQFTLNAYDRGATPPVLAEFVSAITSLSVNQEGQAESVTRLRYTLKNSTAQFLELAVPETLKVWDTRAIEAQPKGGERATRLSSSRDGAVLKIPLRRGANPNEPLMVEVEYSQNHGQLGWLNRLALTLPSSPVLVTYADWQLQAPAGWAVYPAGGTLVPTPSTVKVGIGPFFRYLAERWAQVFQRTAPVWAMMGLLLLLAAVFRRRTVSGLALAVVLLALVGLGALVMARLQQQALPPPPAQVSFAQVLNLDQANALTAEVRLVPAWRYRASLGQTAALVLLLALGAWLRRAACIHRRRLGAGLIVGSILLLLLQFQLGAHLVAHLLTWGLPLLAFGALIYGLSRRRPPLPKCTSSCTTAVALALAVLLGSQPTPAQAADAPAPAKPVAKSVAVRPPPPPAPKVTVESVKAGLRVLPDSLELSLTLTQRSASATLVPIAPTSAVVVTAPPELLAADGLYHLPLPAGQSSASLTLLLPLPAADEQRAVHAVVALPASLTNEVTLSIPGTNLTVLCPNAVQLSVSEVSGNTLATATLLPGADLDFTWQPRSRRTAQEKTVFYTDFTTLVRVDNGYLEVGTLYRLRIAQGELSKLEIALPDGQTVTQVVGQDLAAWRVNPANRMLELAFAHPLTGEYNLGVLAQIAANSLPFQAELGRPTVQGASSQTGMLGIIASPAVTVAVTAHPSPINVEDFARAAAGLLQDMGRRQKADVLHAYSQASAPGTVALTVSAVTPEVRVVESASFSIADERLMYSGDWQIDIAKAGLFSLDLHLPEGYDVESLSGGEISHWDDFDDAGRHVVRVHFQRKLQGQTALALALSRAVPSLPQQLVVPHVTVPDVLKHTGQLIVAVDRGVRLAITARDGVSELDTAQLGLRDKPALAVKLLRPDWRLELQTEVLAPRIDTDFIHVAQVSDGLVRHSHYLQYKLHNAGTKLLEVQLPAKLLSLAITGPEIARKEELPGQPGRWRIELAGKWFDRPYPLTVTYETRFDPEQGEVAIEPVTALDADLQQGFVVVRTTNRIELAAVKPSASLQPAESRMIPRTFGAGELADAAFCYATNTAAYKLDLKASRHGVADLLAAEVSETNVATVISHRGDQMHQVRLTLKVNGLRHLATWLPPRAEVWSLQVDRQSRTPTLTSSAQGERTLLIPLPQNAEGDLPCTVELTYVTPRPGKWSSWRPVLEGPRFDLPLRNVRWTVFAPEGYTYYAFSGTLLVDDRTVQTEEVARYDLRSYLSLASESAAKDTEWAVKLQDKGQQLAKSGNQKAARQALEMSYNLSNVGSDRALNEDARVNLRNLARQQAVVGLVNRRDGLKQAPSQVDLPQGGEFTQEQAERLQGSLSKPDSENLERIATRIIDIQEQAADLALQLMISLPERGRVIAFQRPLQVEPNAPMRVAFRAVPSLANSPWSNWLVLLALVVVVALALTVWPWLCRAWQAYHYRPPKPPPPPPPAAEPPPVAAEPAPTAPAAPAEEPPPVPPQP